MLTPSKIYAVKTRHPQILTAGSTGPGTWGLSDKGGRQIYEFIGQHATALAVDQADSASSATRM